MNDLPPRRFSSKLIAAALAPIFVFGTVFNALPAAAQMEVAPRAAISDAAVARPILAPAAVLAPISVQAVFSAPALESAASLTAAPSAAAAASAALPVSAAAADAAAPALAPVAAAIPAAAAKDGASGPTAGRAAAPTEKAPKNSAREQLEQMAQSASADSDAAVLYGKLGKKDPVLDPRTLPLSKYLGTGLSGPPSAANFYAKVKNWGMMLNDKIGDCTVAACGHQIQQWTANAGTQQTPPDSDILSVYEKITGYNPSDPSSDHGADMLTVLKYWRKLGISGHKIGAFASVDPTNFDHIRSAAWLFGSVYLGIAMPKSAQKQAVWDVPAGGAVGDGQPGSWGGHAVEVAGYGPEGVYVATWGTVKLMTWNFLKTYADEAYAIISKDFLANGKTPNNGLNLAALKADLKTVTDAQMSKRPSKPVNRPVKRPPTRRR